MADDQPTSRSERLEYLDFEIELTRRPDSEDSETPSFRAAVRSPIGQLQAEFELPFSKPELLQLKNDLLQAATRESWRANSGMEELRKRGEHLYRTVFSPELRADYVSSRQRANDAGKGLRIRLVAEDPALVALPWELMREPGAGHFIAQSRLTPIIRSLKANRSIVPPLRRGPFRILGVSASPLDLVQLKLTEEEARLRKALSPLAPDVELEWLYGTTRESLRQALLKPWEVLHFAGHGGVDEDQNEAFVVLEGRARRPDRFSAEFFAGLLRDQPSLRLVVLSACEGANGVASVAAELVKAGIPAVIGMQYPVTDDAAISFSAALYDSIVNGHPIDAAISEGRKALRYGNSFEWITPVLFMASADGVLFPNYVPPQRISRLSSISPLTRVSPTLEQAGSISGELHAESSQKRSQRGRLVAGVALFTLWCTGVAAYWLVGRVSPSTKDPADTRDDMPATQVLEPNLHSKAESTAIEPEGPPVAPSAGIVAKAGLKSRPAAAAPAKSRGVPRTMLQKVIGACMLVNAGEASGNRADESASHACFKVAISIAPEQHSGIFLCSTPQVCLCSIPHRST